MTIDTFDQDSLIVAASGLTFTGGGLTVQASNATGLSDSAIAQTIEGKKSGKWYVEWTCVAVSGNIDGVGIVDSRGVHGSSFIGGDFFGEEMGWGFYTNSHVAHLNSSVTNVNAATYGAGDVIGVAIDLDNKAIWWRINGGSWIGTSGTPDPATNTSGFDITTMLAHGLRVYPAVNLSGSSAQFTANFGDSPMVHAAPSGFGGWTNTTSGQYFGSLASGGGVNGHGEVNIYGNDVLASPYTSPIDGTLDKIIASLVDANSNPLKLAIYAADGAGGIPGTLIGGSTNTVTATTYGEIEFDFSGITLVNGTKYWFAYVNGDTGAAHTSCPPLTNGIYYAASAVPGVPDNPFPGSPSIGNYRYQFLFFYTAGGGGGGAGKNRLVTTSMGF